MVARRVPSWFGKEEPSLGGPHGARSLFSFQLELELHLVLLSFFAAKYGLQTLGECATKLVGPSFPIQEPENGHGLNYRRVIEGFVGHEGFL